MVHSLDGKWNGFARHGNRTEQDGNVTVSLTATVVHCFAASHNSQIAWFHSRFWCPGAEAVDAFTVNWVDEVCWLVPPIYMYLVGRAIRHAEVCRASGTLVVPLWKSAVFWPLLCPDGTHIGPFIHA